mgnify:CR=1 FL=1
MGGDMRGLLESIFFPFLVNQKLWWIIITGVGLSLLIKFAMDYQLAKFHAQTAHTFLSGLEPYRLLKKSNYLIVGILIWTLIASIREYKKTYDKYYWYELAFLHKPLLNAWDKVIRFLTILFNGKS